MNSVMQYWQDEKFELKVEYTGKVDEVRSINTMFDGNTELGIYAISNIITYKNSCNMNCITEEFIEKNKFKDKEKNKLLKSMLNSNAGLFEIVETNRQEGTAYLKNMLNGEEFCITDIGISSNLHNDKIYIYTRLITYNGITFSTGLNLLFDKEDEFINKWIEENKKEHGKKQEIERFIELYNEYIKNDKKFKIKRC